MVKGTFAKLESCRCVVADCKRASSLLAPATPTRAGTSSSSSFTCGRSPILNHIYFIVAFVSTVSIASYHISAINMSLRSKKKHSSLPLFRSPLSEKITLKRQENRVIAGRMDWGTPIGPRRANAWQYTLDFAAAELNGVQDQDQDRDQNPNPNPNPNQSQDQQFKKSCHTALIPLIEHRATRFPVYRCTSEIMAANIGALSPSSSPRLPSPPPFPEVQLGPRSPTMNTSSNTASPGLPNPGNASPGLIDQTKLDDGSTRRIRPGTKAADMASGPPLVPLAEVGFI